MNIGERRYTTEAKNNNGRYWTRTMTRSECKDPNCPCCKATGDAMKHVKPYLEYLDGWIWLTHTPMLPDYEEAQMWVKLNTNHDDVLNTLGMNP